MGGRKQYYLPLPVLLLFFLLAACAAPAQAPAATTVPALTQPPPAVTPSPPAAIQEDIFQNPVLRNNFPDPAITQVGELYYAFATNGFGKNVQAARSPDLVTWEVLPDAMPALASWVQFSRSDVWAPEMIQIGERFVLYYTARHRDSGRQCVGVATSEQPEGRYRDTNDQPLVCQVQEGGSIDAHPFREGDNLYLYWKNDGNCCSLPTYLYVQELAPDGLSLAGEPQRLLRNDAPWEGAVVEAPTMFKYEDGYYLFYSGNSYAGFEYAIGYAVCQSPAGPCEEANENPILQSSREPPLVVGPGHQDVIQIGDQTWIVYHAWEVSSAGMRTDRRFMWMDRIHWEDGRPVVLGPTTDPQPAPEISTP